MSSTPEVVLLTAGSTALILMAFFGYRRYVRRVPTYLNLTPRMLGTGRTLYGRVTSVGDGDNFRFFHTPGGRLLGWGWLRSVPQTRTQLKDQTLMIRLCGVDAPEGAHFGKPAQPHSKESLLWLREYLHNRNVRIEPYLIDQYRRVVARAKVWKWTGKKDISAEMIRRGMGIVYELRIGAEFGGNELWYRRLEDRARRSKLGVWGIKKMETPGEYKRRTKSE